MEEQVHNFLSKPQIVFDENANQAYGVAVTQEELMLRLALKGQCHLLEESFCFDLSDQAIAKYYLKYIKQQEYLQGIVGPIREELDQFIH